MIPPRRKTHIEFYLEHGIAPVQYDLSDMAMHLQRREALYTKLCLPPVAFRGSRVLEVAAGTGQNSLYVAQLLPAPLVLLEPNPAAVEHLHRAYAAFDRTHTTPEIVCLKLEEYDADDSFDIVLCENWLGGSDSDLALLDKLARMVAPSGILVVTTVSPIGFVPNLLRRFLVPGLIGSEPDFDVRSRRLAAAFAPHLRNVAGMTRSVEDWVQDNMLNPAYFGVCLTIPTIIEKLGDRLDVLGSCPVFAEDWRWFKTLAGAGRRINEHFLQEYWRKAHNFLDHQEPPFSGHAEVNWRLEQAALEVLKAIEFHEDAWVRADDASPWATRVREHLKGFMDAIPDGLSRPAAALHEFVERAFDLPPGAVDAVARMERFGGLFGRETTYLSLLRPPYWASGAKT